MRFVTFNAFRTIGIPNVAFIKPEHMYKELALIREADVVLFPETWQVPSLVYGLKKKIFPSIETIQLGQNKIEMTRALWTVCPDHVPYTQILASTPANVEKVLADFSFPFVAKEAKNSMGNGVFLIRDAEQFRAYANHNDVLYVQELLQSDRDLRVCVVGKEIVASYWRIGADGAFHHNVAQGGTVSYDLIPMDVVKLVRRIAKQLNVNHAGFDILIADGHPYILEFNVLFGNQGLKNLGASIEQKILEYVTKQFAPRHPRTPRTPSGRKRIS